MFFSDRCDITMFDMVELKSSTSEEVDKGAKLLKSHKHDSTTVSVPESSLAFPSFPVSDKGLLKLL